MTAELIAHTDIERRPGYLYFCKGNPIDVYEVAMKRGGGRKKKDNQNETTTKETKLNVVSNGRKGR